jgi:hypothetical protein
MIEQLSFSSSHRNIETFERSTRKHSDLLSRETKRHDL